MLKHLYQLRIPVLPILVEEVPVPLDHEIFKYQIFNFIKLDWSLFDEVVLNIVQRSVIDIDEFSLISSVR